MALTCLRVRWRHWNKERSISRSTGHALSLVTIGVRVATMYSRMTGTNTSASHKCILVELMKPLVLKLLLR